MAHGLPAGSLYLLLRGLLIGYGGKARSPLGRWMVVLPQGLHTALGGSWEHGDRLCLGLSQVGNEPPMPVGSGGGLEGCRGRALPACACH